MERAYCLPPRSRAFFFFNDTATTEIYTLSLHDALPISGGGSRRGPRPRPSGRSFASRASPPRRQSGSSRRPSRDRKSTRLNSSHGYISYAVFCLKKKTPNLHHLVRRRAASPSHTNATTL